MIFEFETLPFFILFIYSFNLFMFYPQFKHMQLRFICFFLNPLDLDPLFNVSSHSS